MRKCFYLTIFLLLSTLVWAAIPPSFINYQGVLRDSSGDPENGSFDMVFRFYDSLLLGNLLLTDTHAAAGSGAVTVSNGLFNVSLGGGTITTGTESTVPDVFRNNASVYLEVQVGSETLSPRIRIISSAYSLNTDNLDGEAGSFYRDASNIFAGILSNARFSAYNDLGTEGYLDNDAGVDLLTRTQLDARYLMSGIVAMSMINAVPRWNGVSLVDGIMRDDGLTMGIKAIPAPFATLSMVSSENNGIQITDTGTTAHGVSSIVNGIGVYGKGGNAGIFGETSAASAQSAVQGSNVGGGSYGVRGDTASIAGVYGTPSFGSGITGNSTGSPPYGVHGDSAMGTVGVLGTQTAGPGTAGVSGVNGGPTGIFGYDALGNINPVPYGVWGEVGYDSVMGADGVFGTVNNGADNSGSSGVHGICTIGSGIWGFQNLSPAIGPTDYGVWGDNGGDTVERAGVFGTVGNEDISQPSSSAGVWGINIRASCPPQSAYPGPLPPPIEEPSGLGSPAEYGVRGMTGSDFLGSAGVLGETELPFTAGVYGRCPIENDEMGGGGCYGLYSDGDTYIAGNGYVAANLTVFGGLNVWGPKAAAVKTEDYGNRRLYAVESPGNWFEDFGHAKLVEGEAIIEIEPIFAQTVNLNTDYYVFLTPNGDCGLFIAEKTPTFFTVRALNNASCEISFDYRIVAKRKGFEQVRLELIKEPTIQ